MHSTQQTLHQDWLTGVIERITYHAPESGYTVARLKVPRASDLITIVGSFANIQAGQTLQLQGQWRDHPQYGSQFQVIDYKETKPATLTGMEKYLGSGLIKGVGPVTARRIVGYFGLETLDIIEHQIDRLIEVPGIAKKRIKMIQSAWEQQKAIKEVMLFLSSHGVSTTYAVKIYKQYGKEAIALVTNNPYQLAIDVYGIGFLTADKIARQVGVSPHSKFRYQAGVLHILSKAAEDGHCYLPQSQLLKTAIELLSFEEHQAEAEAIANILSEMVESEQLVTDFDGAYKHLGKPQVTAPQGETLYYKPSFFYAEQNLAKLLKQHLSSPIEVDLERVRNWLARFTATNGIKLSPQQWLAVEMAAREKVLILTGGPGTGKTFLTRTIVALWKAMGQKIMLAAPTGRAAQRLSEMTGMEAKTLHRTLEFDPATLGFKRDKDNPLPCTAIVIDESSMVDLFLAHSLVKAIATDTQLLIVGDIDQLPSVGAGNVLKDLIDSEQIPVVRLTQVFRQAAESGIVRTAHQINRGQYPQLEPISNNPNSDCLWHSGGSEPEHGIQTICDLIEHFLPAAGFNPAVDLQVLCPMTRGVVGTRNLNKILQQLINPPGEDKAELVRGDSILRTSDRVMQLKNDYNKEIFNGDLGTVMAIDHIDKEVIIDFDGREVSYDYADLNELTLAWATSIHKSQGSEYPVVILPLYTQHYVMLSRNLFYTGLTRAKKLAIIVGSEKAIAIAVKQLKQQQRYTRLKERLEGRK
jgi:exodeoxyribonuclease V alpha subunit